MHTYQAETMDDLHTAMCLDIAFASDDELDATSGVDVTKFNVLGVAESMTWNQDIKTVWLGKARWTMMVRQYLDPEEVVKWLNLATDRIGTKGRGTAVLRTRIVKPRGGAATGHTNKETRRWGSCMLSLSYRATPRPTITLHSRTSYLGYLSMLDFTIAHVLAKYLAQNLGIPLEDFKFVWMAESVQWHGFKSLPWLLCNTDDNIRSLGRRVLLKKLATLDDGDREKADTWAMTISRRWINFVRREDQAGKHIGLTNYNTYRRVRRRWQTEVRGYEYALQFEGWNTYKRDIGVHRAGDEKEFFKAYQPLPHCWTGDFDLGPIGISLTSSDSNGKLIEPDLYNEGECLACGEDEFDPEEM